SGTKLSQVVVPATRSRTNTLVLDVVPTGASVVAALVNATNRPSAEIDGGPHAPFDSVPEELTLTRSERPEIRSQTNTALNRLRSSATRLLAGLENAT